MRAAPKPKDGSPLHGTVLLAPGTYRPLMQVEELGTWSLLAVGGDVQLVAEAGPVVLEVDRMLLSHHPVLRGDITIRGRGDPRYSMDAQDGPPRHPVRGAPFPTLITVQVVPNPEDEDEYQRSMPLLLGLRIIGGITVMVHPPSTPKGLPTLPFPGAEQATQARPHRRMQWLPSQDNAQAVCAFCTFERGMAVDSEGVMDLGNGAGAVIGCAWPLALHLSTCRDGHIVYVCIRTRINA